ncbi:hypothetical protein ABZ951_08620 [Streptomyces sp. NPDC046215]|uniref:Integral membrane protein n=1 Tax=Streptomyces stramineus TaxID=173861 RepID=A0ABN0ZL68_9ACTN
MSNQPHHAYEPREPYDPYEQREGYDPYGQQPGQSAPQPQQAQQPQQTGYDAYNPYAPYDQQAAAQAHQAQHQAQQAQQNRQPDPHAWPTTQGGQQGYAAQQEPVTQTWQTPTWDTQTWQRPAEPSHGSPWHGAPLPEETPAGQPGRAHPAPADGPSGQAGRHRGAPAAPAAPEPDPEPGPAAGERPLTAAEKAKAEGRPQILSPGFRPAVLTAVLSALLAVAAPLGQPALAVPVVLLQAVTAAGWFRLNGMWPARQGIALAFLGGVVADIGLLVTDEAQAPTVLIGTLGVWVLLTIALQLRSRAGADERLYGLMVAGASAALTVVAAGQLAAASDAVVVGAAGVAVAALARALPLPSLLSPVIALIAAAGSGVATGQITGLGAQAALLGLAAGVCALVGLRAASYDYPSRFVHMTAGVALPLAAAAPAVYVLGRALT